MMSVIKIASSIHGCELTMVIVLCRSMDEVCADLKSAIRSIDKLLFRLKVSLYTRGHSHSLTGEMNQSRSRRLDGQKAQSLK